MQAYAIKSAREGKEQTSWLAPDEAYENGLTQFLGRLLDRSHSARFIDTFEAFARRTALIGALKSLTQLVLKAMMPGVPDFYQGTEFWDLSLVDPDNRRPVDFQARASLLKVAGDEPDWPALISTWPSGQVKFASCVAFLLCEGGSRTCSRTAHIVPSTLPDVTPTKSWRLPGSAAVEP
jgi:(1->4)-alpha-D-glucan 1-alpha-D-glucosylmutase